jgi:septal ring factor EnvC (AmiA/AmiB activator)
MKKSILFLTLPAFLMGAILTACMTPAQKVTHAKKDVAEAKKDVEEAKGDVAEAKEDVAKARVDVAKAQEDLDKANKEYLADIESYRKETLDKIVANDRSIAEFVAKIENEKEEEKAEYQKKISELRQKNNKMKDKMNEYKAEGRDKWQIFKSEFNHDMNELGKAFKDLVVKNTK